MSGRDFPILRPREELVWCPASIPWEAIAPHEDQARINHGATLERLAERGGLSVRDAVRVLEDREADAFAPETRASLEQAVARLSELVAKECRFSGARTRRRHVDEVCACSRCRAMKSSGPNDEAYDPRDDPRDALTICVDGTKVNIVALARDVRVSPEHAHRLSTALRQAAESIVRGGDGGPVASLAVTTRAGFVGIHAGDAIVEIPAREAFVFAEAVIKAGVEAIRAARDCTCAACEALRVAEATRGQVPS